MESAALYPACESMCFNARARPELSSRTTTSAGATRDNSALYDCVFSFLATYRPRTSHVVHAIKATRLRDR